MYTGETGRTLKVRMAEHKGAVRMGDVNNGLAVHSLKTGHPIEWSQARVVEREENWYVWQTEELEKTASLDTLKDEPLQRYFII